MSLRIVSEFADRQGVVGYVVTSLRFDPVHDNTYMKLYATIQETGHPSPSTPAPPGTPISGCEP